MSNTKKFLSSVGDAYLYDLTTGTEIFRGKTLIDTSIEVSSGSTDVRGGKGNPLLYSYFHSGEMSVNITEAQFNLTFLGSMVGSDVGVGTNVFQEETITLGASGTGTITGTPLALPGITPIYGWVKHVDGTVEKVTFSTKTFAESTGTSGDVVCVRFYAASSAAQYINVNANMLPKIGRLVIDAQLNSSDVSSNRIGSCQIEIPKAQLQPSFTLSLTADGVANTPLTARALQDENLTSAACSPVPVLAKITEILDSANWWDSVIALAIVGGDFALATTLGTRQIQVYALRADGTAAFNVPDYSDLTFSSATTGVATISNAGLVTGIIAGTSLLKATITSANTIEASCTVTVPS